jgi:hypothetical protein
VEVIVGAPRLATWPAAAVVVAAALIAPSRVGAATAPTDPRHDPFYAVPAKIADFSPGAVLDSREVTPAAFGSFGIQASAWQVKYRTTDHKGEPTATVTTILVPNVAAPVAGRPRPVVSYQTAEDSNSLQCAPSYGLLSAAPVDNPASQAETIIIAAYLAKGDIVVVPDYEGPKSLYTVGIMAGRATLDGIRAAKVFSPAGIAPDAPVGITGYSGGALATEWAAQLQPAYAPDVRLSAVVAGGVPVNIQHIADRLASNPLGLVLSGIALNGITGQYNAHPELSSDAAQYLTDRGRAIIAKLSTVCGGDAVADYPLTPYSVMFTVHDALTTIPQLKSIITASTLGGATPAKVPTHLYESVSDEVTVPADVDALVKQDCAAGVPISYDRDLLSEHVTLAVTGAPAAIRFMQGTLTGARTTTGCTTRTTISTALSPTAALATLELLLGLPRVFG